jgi:uncharacterized membrane protein
MLILILAFSLGLAILAISAMFLSHFLMMGGSFGGMGGGMITAMLGPMMLVAAAGVGIGVLVYYLLLPDIKPADIVNVPPPADYREAVLRMLKDDERRVVAILTDGGGIALQRDIQRATGFSKVKTHRVVARLAERRLIEVRPYGRTNQISLPPWLIGGTQSIRET